MINDSDLVFILHVYKEAPTQLDWCLTNIRTIYPNTRIAVISDGTENAEYQTISQKHSAEYTLGERLSTIDKGALIWHRLLGIYMQQPAKYVFKIDPDTYIRRRFNYLPQDGAFGTIPQGGHIHIQGGCIGIAHSKAKQLYESKIFTSELYQDWVNWATPSILKRILLLKLTSFDYTLRAACLDQDIPMTDYGEIACLWKNEIEFPERFAVTHPHRL